MKIRQFMISVKRYFDLSCPTCGDERDMGLCWPCIFAQRLEQDRFMREMENLTREPRRLITDRARGA